VVDDSTSTMQAPVQRPPLTHPTLGPHVQRRSGNDSGSRSAWFSELGGGRRIFPSRFLSRFFRTSRFLKTASCPWMRRACPLPAGYSRLSVVCKVVPNPPSAARVEEPLTPVTIRYCVLG
jgi:hypothetical protein